MHLHYGSKPLTEVERAFAKEAYKVIRSEIGHHVPVAIKPKLTPEERLEKKRAYQRSYFRNLSPEKKEKRRAWMRARYHRMKAMTAIA